MKEKLKQLGRVLLYCGVSKEQYNSVKKTAYVSNFNVWKTLHMLMLIIFVVCSVISAVTHNGDFQFYVMMAAYSLAMSAMFWYVLKKESIVAQFLIYLSMVLLLLLGVRHGLADPSMKAVTFEIMLVVLAAFMIDKPYFMAILLTLSAVIYLVHAYEFKPFEVFRADLLSTVIFTGIGVFINIFYNTLRIQEFLLRLRVERQRDTDTLTGLWNRRAYEAAVERLHESKAVGVVFCDLNNLKNTNDRLGHNAGDELLNRFAGLLLDHFPSESIFRISGDEFVVLEMNPDERIFMVAAEGLRGDLFRNEEIGAIGVRCGSVEEASVLLKEAETEMYENKKEIHLRHPEYARKEINEQ